MQGKSGRSLSGKSGIVYVYALCIDTQAESMSNVVMDVTPNMIFVIGSDMKILDCNRKGQDLLGVGREEAVQRYIF